MHSGTVCLRCALDGMLFLMTPHLLAVIVLVLGAEFVNGYTDAPNATATAVATGLLTRRKALWWAAVSNLLGLLPTLVFGAAVATTIGKGIVDPKAISLDLIAAAMCSVIIWGRTAALIGLPVSKSHALFAALAGAAFVGGGMHALIGAGWIKIAQGIGISIVVASSLSWILGRLTFVIQRSHPLSAAGWRRLQLFTLTLVAGMHGWNDGLKFVGVLALVLFLGGVTPQFTVTPGIILVCGVVMGAGTLCGGWRIVARITKMTKNDCKPWQGVVAESVSALCIGISAFGGVPMSTTHTVVSSIAGASGSVSAKDVHWATAGLIAWGWLLTIVVCGLSAALFSVVGWQSIVVAYVLAEAILRYWSTRQKIRLQPIAITPDVQY
jgi:PiT family inorganic phosphate transporter